MFVFQVHPACFICLSFTSKIKKNRETHNKGKTRSKSMAELIFIGEGLAWGALNLTASLVTAGFMRLVGIIKRSH